MKRPLDQEVTKRKWSADKSAGPLVFLAELLQKRLIQHAWPCSYAVRWSVPYMGPEENQQTEQIAEAIFFKPLGKRPALSVDFWDAFDSVLRIVAHEQRCAAYRDQNRLYLDGPHYLNKYGKIRRGNPPAPF